MIATAVRAVILALGVAAGRPLGAAGLEGSEALQRREVEVAREIARVRAVRDAREPASASLAYAAGLLRHAADEALRRVASYGAVAEVRERQTRMRARGLYKLGRGGLARIVFERPGAREPSHAERIARGRTLRSFVRHDLRELGVYTRARARAAEEVVAAARELQAVHALHMLESLQEGAIAAFERDLEPAVQDLHRQRRAAGRRGASARAAERRLEALVATELASVTGADHPVFQPGRVDRPISGAIVGGFGATTDPVLRVPVLRNGVELRARRSDEVRAVAAGHVAFVGPLPGLGDVVVVDHGAGWLSLTGRLFVAAVGVGDAVEAGTILGRPQRKTLDDGLGTTVYLELRHGERPVDPTPLLRPSR